MMAVARQSSASERVPVQEEVDGDGEAERDDDGAQDFVADAPGIARAGIAANGAGDHHVPAEAPLDGSVDDEGDDGDTVGDGGDDDLERIDLGEALDSAERQCGHGEQARSGTEVANVITDAQKQREQRDEGDMYVTRPVLFDAALDGTRDGSADGEGDGAH